MDRHLDTPQGPILTRVENGLVYARSIPYATAERWKQPVPARWAEVRNCTKAGPVCPQHKSRFEFVIGKMPLGDREFSEDCLTVTVVAPEHAKNLPVLVWYHGGANIAGATDIDVFDTTPLAALGLVVVSVQYRLGVYGCIEVPGMATSNLHVYDQMEALRWTKDNISVFGGDSSNVTIIGQSAGGWAIYNMLLTATDGLFRKAIIISAPLEIQRKTGYGELVKRKLPGDLLEIQAACSKQMPGIEYFTADRTQAPFPADPDARLAERKDIELLIGWTADEVIPYLHLEPWTKILVNLPLIGGAIAQVLGRAGTNRVFKRGSQALAQKWSQNGGHVSTWEFKWYPRGSPFGACHCIEAPLMFGDWSTWTKAPMMAGRDSEQIWKRLAPEFKQMLLAFINDGLRNGRHIEITEEFGKHSYT